MPRAPKIPAPPIPGPLKEPPPRPGESNGAGLDDHLKEAGITRRRLGRRAHLPERRGPLADVPQGPERDQLVLHARLGHAVRLPQPGRHGRVPGDVLPPRRLRRGLRIDPLRHQRRVPGPVRAGHAQVGLERDGRARVPAHGARVLLRRLQVPARAQLGDRRGAADPDDGDVVHRLPAAVRPARLLGDDRGGQHQRHRPAAWPLPERLLTRGLGIRRHHAVALLCHPYAADTRAADRPDRRAPVPGDEARHDRPAVGQSQKAPTEASCGEPLAPRAAQVPRRRA